MKSPTREKYLIYLFLIFLGFAAGITYERHTRPPVQFRSNPASVSEVGQAAPQFSTLTELKLHEFEKEIRILKRAYKEHKNSNPTELRRSLEEMDQITSEALEFALQHSADYVTRNYVRERCWFLLASDRAAEAKAFYQEHLTNGDAPLASGLAWVHEEFEVYDEAADVLRKSISGESDLFYQWERRLRLCRVLVKDGNYDSAQTEIESLESELAEATQKRQIVGLTKDLWRIREELAAGRGDEDAAERARQKATEYHEYWMKLRR